MTFYRHYWPRAYWVQSSALRVSPGYRFMAPRAFEDNVIIIRLDAHKVDYGYDKGKTSNYGFIYLDTLSARFTLVGENGISWE